MVHILHANSLDATAMARIHQAGFAHGWDESTIRLLLDKPTSLALAAFETSNDAIGFILLRQIDDEAEILSIATDPKKRRKGIARLLLAHALELTQLRGASKMFLEVSSKNKAALKLYDKLGFVETGRRQGYYSQGRGKPEDAILMTKTISG